MSNVAITRLCFKAGVDPAKTLVVDSQGILHAKRQDIFMRRAEFVDKWRLCQMTNAAGRQGGIAEALVGADVCVASSKPGPGTIQPEWVAQMAHDAIIFACANPVPEIWPWEATATAGATIATGRSDFPNQVNNSLGFPGIFRGALMCVPRRSPMRCASRPPRRWLARLRTGHGSRLHPADDDRMGSVRQRSRGGGHEGARAGHRPRRIDCR